MLYNFPFRSLQIDPERTKFNFHHSIRNKFCHKMVSYITTSPYFVQSHDMWIVGMYFNGQYNFEW